MTTTAGNNGDGQAPTNEQVSTMCKDVLEEVINNNSHQQGDFAKWNQQAVELLTKRLVDLNRPFKYCVTCIVMQSGLGAGMNVSSTSYLDKTCDQNYSVKWDNKSVVAVLTIFAIKYSLSTE